MPVRSLNSRVLKWPDSKVVRAALRNWAEQALASRGEILRIGYLGSYARGDWGVGSDLDVIVVVASSSLPFESRNSLWDVTALPVPADLLIYTEEEWQALLDSQSRFSRVIRQEAVWVYPGTSETSEKARWTSLRDSC
jgi:uncharacterized protein